MVEKACSSNTFDIGVNTTFHMSNGPLRRTPSLRPTSAIISSNGTPLNACHLQPQATMQHTVTLIVVKDDKGYGMKVSGDNPVYVQSVKDGGAAERAGLHSGDKIIKVNGTDVTHSTHTEVVELIKACVEVELTVQQRIPHSGSGRCSLGLHTPPPSVPVAQNSVSPMPAVATTTTVTTPVTPSSIPKPLHHHHSAPARDRITAPQPVDHEKLRQLECQRVQTFRLMLEKEQRYVEALRTELSKCTDSSSKQQISRDLMGAERRVKTLQEQLSAITSHSSTSSRPTSPDSQLLTPPPPPPPPLSTLPTRKSDTLTNSSTLTSSSTSNSSNHSFNHNRSSPSPCFSSSSPPPLPSRYRILTSPVMVSCTSAITSSPPPLPPRQYLQSPTAASMVDGIQDRLSPASSKSPTSPRPVHHQRTKSSPDQIGNHVPMTLPADSVTAKRLVSSESMSDLSSVKRSRGGLSWDVDSKSPFVSCADTPPPLPPLPPSSSSSSSSPASNNHSTRRSSPSSPPVPPLPSDETEELASRDEVLRSPTSQTELIGSPLNCSTLNQHQIISMEDDDVSDQEMSNLEDHGPFKNFTRLMEHNAHLAVFLNYVISNSDPSSLLFYLVTNLYKEGNGKEMKKWAYEIHSSFLVPGAPLRLSNVDENIAREIDETLLNNADKEEELRKVFQKARKRAREEINEQLTDFQQKRTAGLGTLFGPPDVQLDESIHDKSKELKIVEQVLIPKMEPFIDDIEKEIVDDRRFAIAAAFGTILSKIFGVRGAHFTSLLERCPTFVSKEKSFKARLIGRSRKVTAKGHHFVAHQYFTVTYCNHCQLIIWGIGPQGYQCTNCLLNIHRPCVKVLEESCPGPLVKKEKANDRISKFMEKIRPEREPRRGKPGSVNIGQEKTKKQVEDNKDEGSVTDNEIADKTANSGGKNNHGHNSLSVVGGNAGGNNGPTAVTCANSCNSSGKVDACLKETAEERLEYPRGHRDLSQRNFENNDSSFLSDMSPHNLLKNKSSGASINRSESYKERIHPKRQVREKRKTSDPNLSKTNSDVEIDNAVRPFAYHVANSGSSSNSNLSTRSLDSPSNSLEAVGKTNSSENNVGSCSTSSNTLIGSICGSRTSAWDSDTEAEPDPPDWTKSVPEEILKQLSAAEKKRQEVINELFHTERSHVRALKILDQLFYQPMKELQILPLEQVQLLFPNLEEMLEIHSQFNNSMKIRKAENPVVQEVGDILLKMFDGAAGEIFKHAAATFCSRQQIALASLKERRRKDPKLNNFLSDAEGNPICRRLQLKDIIPTGMLRLTKYPLLFENLVKYTHAALEEEKRCIQRALERSREILNHVNAAVKQAEDQHRLSEIQKRLDKTLFDKLDHPVTNEFKNLDLTKHKLIYEGTLSWRIANRPKMLEVHVLLLEDLIILFQKQDEKYVMKYYNTNSAGERTPILSPVIKVSTAIVRPNATDKKALYLVNTSHNGAQIYDLVASSSSEKKTWFRHISDATEAYRTKDGKHKSRTPEPSPILTRDVEATTAQQKAKLKHDERSKPEEQECQEERDNTSLNSSIETQSTPTKKLGGGGKSPAKQKRGAESQRVKREENLPGEPSPRLIREENLLIEPSQVLISQRSVLTAESVLSPLEKLRRKDEIIKETLKEKQQLVIDILRIPSEEVDVAEDTSAETVYDKEASDIVLAAINQTNHLASIINDCLQVNEEEAVIATSEVHSSQQLRTSSSHVPSVPVSKLQPISDNINQQLTHLLKLMKEKDEERERLRQELQRSREQLHAMHEVQRRVEQMQHSSEQVMLQSSGVTTQDVAADSKLETGSVMKDVSEDSSGTKTSKNVDDNQCNKTDSKAPQ